MYTLWSHGRLLGTTDLAWARALPRHRAGDLHPTPLGETLLPAARGSHAELPLELRGPDGEVVPTEDLWIQDSEYLLAVADETPLPDEPEPEWMDDLEADAWDPELDAMLAEVPDLPDPPEPDDDEPEEAREWPRYQVMLRLIDDAAIP